MSIARHNGRAIYVGGDQDGRRGMASVLNVMDVGAGRRREGSRRAARRGARERREAAFAAVSVHGGAATRTVAANYIDIFSTNQCPRGRHPSYISPSSSSAPVKSIVSRRRRCPPGPAPAGAASRGLPWCTERQNGIVQSSRPHVCRTHRRQRHARTRSGRGAPSRGLSGHAPSSARACAGCTPPAPRPPRCRSCPAARARRSQRAGAARRTRRARGGRCAARTAPS